MPYLQWNSNTSGANTSAPIEPVPKAKCAASCPATIFHDWAVIGFIALGSSLLVWLPLLV